MNLHLFVLYCIVLMGWSLLPNVLRPMEIYCALPTIISQLVLFLWQTVEIDPLGHVRVVEALQKFGQKCDHVLLSDFHIDIAGVQLFHGMYEMSVCVFHSPLFIFSPLVFGGRPQVRGCFPVVPVILCVVSRNLNNPDIVIKVV